MNQFPAPSSETLGTPLGEASPMRLLWTFMGASRPYTWFAGGSEVLAGLLLVWRRTSTLGAMIAAGVMTNVVLLNFCYDVPVKLFSAHLLVTALLILLPHGKDIFGFFFSNQPTNRRCLNPPFTNPKTIWLHRIGKLIAVVFCVAVPFYQHLKTEWSRPLPADDESKGWATVQLKRYPFAMGGGEGVTDTLQVSRQNKSSLRGTFKLKEDDGSFVLLQGFDEFDRELQFAISEDDQLELKAKSDFNRSEESK